MMYLLKKKYSLKQTDKMEITHKYRENIRGYQGRVGGWMT